MGLIGGLNPEARRILIHHKFIGQAIHFVPVIHDNILPSNVSANSVSRSKITDFLTQCHKCLNMVMRVDTLVCHTAADCQKQGRDIIIIVVEPFRLHGLERCNLHCRNSRRNNVHFSNTGSTSDRLANHD